MAGYSPNPLVKKLGMKEGDKILLLNVPDNYAELIDQWPIDVEIVDDSQTDNINFIHYFTQEKKKLVTEFPLLKQKLKKGGGLWISWPKGTSKIPKNLNGNDVREIGLKNGLVDVKVCAVDDDWSGLKFMYRTKDK